MAFCGKCGEKVSEEFNFCSFCGAPLYNTNNAAGASNNKNDFSYQYHPDDIQKGKAVSALAYVWILFFLPLVVYPESKFGRFHANQALVLLIASVVLGFALGLLDMVLLAIPAGMVSYGYYTSPFWILLIGIINLFGAGVGLVFMIIGMVNAASGQAKELPIIGRIRLIK